MHNAQDDVYPAWDSWPQATSRCRLQVEALDSHHRVRCIVPWPESMPDAAKQTRDFERHRPAYLNRQQGFDPRRIWAFSLLSPDPSRIG